MKQSGRSRYHAQLKPVPLNRALSKLGILSRARATEAITAGRVRVNGRVVVNPLAPVVPERILVRVDEQPATRAAWRTILFNKPRGVVTTRRDPEGRPTAFDVLGDAGRGLVAAGRLDLASTGLLILTTDTRLAGWLTDPANAVPRVYAVSVRGRPTEDEVRMLTGGVRDRGELLRASAVHLRKASARESHLIVELRQGRNREVRRLLAAVGREVTKLKRVRFGGLELGDLGPGEWREVSREEIRSAFPTYNRRAEGAP